ncbi:MAG: protein kinase [Deltaproteobacteria bacterium]|nr:protein kinase [Deltaproteobacteria bacterium]
MGGDFRILSPLAEGGMGAVYLVEQQSTGKRRALKVMHLSIANDQASIQRFVREAQVGSRIESEHVVEVIAAGLDAESGLPWLAMELLEGGSLASVVEQRGRLPPADLLRVYQQMAHALSAAHRAGIVHRDLKPENVYVAMSRRSDSALTVKVLDFGIAKLVASATSAHNSQLIGSPLWMAPEQLQPNAPIGPTTDVWALGLIAFYLLTGRFYWIAANQQDVGIQMLIAEMVVSPIVPASERAAALGVGGVLPAGFDAWFARAVARDPADRFASVDALMAALPAALQGGPRPWVGAAAAPPVAWVPTVASSQPRPASMPRLAATQAATSLPFGASGSPLPGTVVGTPASLARTPQPVSSTGPVAEPRRSASLLVLGGAAAVLVVIAVGAIGYFATTARDAPHVEAEPTTVAPVVAATTTSLTAPAGRPPGVPTVPAPSVVSPPPLQTPYVTQDGGPVTTPAVVASPLRAPSVASPPPTDGVTVSRGRERGRGGATGGATAQPSAPTSGLPSTPSRADVTRAFSSVRSAIQQCAGSRSGSVRLNVVFDRTGQVRDVTVSGALAGTAEGACMARVARRMRVPPFANPSHATSYPVQLSVSRPTSPPPSGSRPNYRPPSSSGGARSREPMPPNPF